MKQRKELLSIRSISPNPSAELNKAGPYERKFLLLGLGLSQPRVRIGTAPKSAWFCAFSVATLESQILASNGRNGRSNPTHSTRRKGAKSERDCLLWFKSRMVWVSWPRSSQAGQWSWPENSPMRRGGERESEGEMLGAGPGQESKSKGERPHSYAWIC